MTTQPDLKEMSKGYFKKNRGKNNINMNNKIAITMYLSIISVNINK